MREETVQIICDASGAQVEPVDLGIIPEDVGHLVPVDMPEGWLAMTLTRVVPNPAKTTEPPDPMNPNDPNQVFAYMQAKAEFDDAPEFILQDVTLVFSPGEIKQALVGVPSDVLAESEFGDLA